jgi:hypothetical protein
MDISSIDGGSVDGVMKSLVVENPHVDAIRRDGDHCAFRKRYPKINLDYTPFKFPVFASNFAARARG